jgi:hypothetical protein
MDIVHAAVDWKNTLGGPDKDVATIQSLEPLFSNVVQAVVALLGVALLVMFFVAGFGYLFSGGDPKKVEQAKGTLTNAIIGLIVIVSAYIVLNLIGVITGTDVTTFRITFF